MCFAGCFDPNPPYELPITEYIIESRYALNRRTMQFILENDKDSNTSNEAATKSEANLRGQRR